MILNSGKLISIEVAPVAEWRMHRVYMDPAEVMKCIYDVIFGL